tara:strand:+ start:53 stop:349 length:297 start_codon:yes stop_codon:yes gene_type:complete
LNYDKKVKSIYIDAREFDSYADFDIYFLFNPFKASIYYEVINKILEQNERKEKKVIKYLIDFCGCHKDILKTSQKLRLIKDEKCPYRELQILIYEIAV